jgi:squalene-hopene/tetraprenyl-beta-curcumene cyclase
MAILAWCLCCGTAAPPAAAADEGLPPGLRARAQKSIDRGLAFLRSAQTADGGWTEPYGPAITAICANAFLRDRDHGADHPVVRRALSNIERYVQADGGIYERRQNLANYQTSVVLSFLAALDDPSLSDRVGRAQRFLVKLQYDENESVDRNNVWYGGAGYNEDKRPDLSNTQMMLQALHDSGLEKSDPVYQRALVFISRCQMNRQTNDQPFAREAADGGFIYSPANEGESKASQEVTEGRVALRSYGSMTYAGFKSLLFCGLDRDDPRVKAAYDWIRRHYTLDKNASMPGERSKQGLYYYYYVFARALNAWGEPVVVDSRGTSHFWRAELCEKLISLQRQDGRWLNEHDRWMEGDANYITGLTCQTLQAAMDEKIP